MPKKETFKKSVIIKKVAKVFYEKGYNLTSMQDIVDTTGLNRSSIYNSFGNKQKLFMLCLKAHQSDLIRGIQQIIIDSNNSIKGLQSIFEFTVKSNNKGNFINSCICEVVNQDAVAKEFLKDHQTYIIRLFEDLIVKGQNTGAINNSKTAHQYALYLFAAFQGLQIASVLMESTTDLDNIIYTTLSIIQ